MFSKLSTKIAVLISVMLVGITVASAQGQGSIEGTVADPTGAVVSGAQLTATHTATGTTFKTASKGDGFFEFPLLPVGVYDVAVNKEGFATLAEKGVKLTIGAKLSLRLELKVSGTTKTVEVTAEPPLGEPPPPQASQPVDNQPVPNLPTNSRHFLDF